MSLHFDKKLVSNFASIKGDDENFIWIGKPSFKPFAINVIIGVLITCTATFGIFMIHLYIGMNDFFEVPIVYLFMVLFGGLINLGGIVQILSYKNIFYGFSDKRIIFKTGYFGIKFKTVEYDKIIDIELDTHLVDRYFNTGTIRFDSGKTRRQSEGHTTKISDNLDSIENPYEIFKMIKKISLDIKTDYLYPNGLRPLINPGYNTKYNPI